jgi:hypothetical protein
VIFIILGVGTGALIALMVIGLFASAKGEDKLRDVASREYK